MEPGPRPSPAPQRLPGRRRPLSLREGAGVRVLAAALLLAAAALLALPAARASADHPVPKCGEGFVAVYGHFLVPTGGTLPPESSLPGTTISTITGGVLVSVAFCAPAPATATPPASPRAGAFEFVTATPVRTPTPTATRTPVATSTSPPAQVPALPAAPAPGIRPPSTGDAGLAADGGSGGAGALAGLLTLSVYLAFAPAAVRPRGAAR
jgi:hypothetical protein